MTETVAKKTTKTVTEGVLDQFAPLINKAPEAIASLQQMEGTLEGLKPGALKEVIKAAKQIQDQYNNVASKANSEKLRYEKTAERMIPKRPITPEDVERYPSITKLVEVGTKYKAVAERLNGIYEEAEGIRGRAHTLIGKAEGLYDKRKTMQEPQDTRTKVKKGY